MSSLACRAVTCSRVVSHQQTRSIQYVPQPRDEDVPYIQTDRVVRGFDRDLNWSLIRCQVVPTQFQSFRNETPKYLVSRSQNSSYDRATKTLTANVSKTELDASWQYVGDPDTTPPRDGRFSPITPAEYKALWKLVTHHLSQPDHALFTHDGAMGTAPGSITNVRVITERAENALALRNLMVDVKLGDAWYFKHPVTVYWAADLKLSSPANYGLKQNESFVLVNPHFQPEDPKMPSEVVRPRGKSILIGGSPSVSTVKAALVSLAQEFFSAQESCVLHSQLLLPAGAAAPSLFIGAHSGVVDQAAGKVGSTHHVWSPTGVSRLFEGNEYDAKAVAATLGLGHLVEALPNKASSVLKRGDILPNLLVHPQAVALCVSDSSGDIPAVAKITAEQAAMYYLVGYTGQPGSSAFRPCYSADAPMFASPATAANTLLSLLKQCKASVYLVNTHGNSADVQKTLTAIATGKETGGKNKISDALVKRMKEFATNNFPGEEYAGVIAGAK